MEDLTQASCNYRLDSHYRIIYVNPTWSLFAEKNGSTGLEPETILGTPIWKYIADEETIDLYYVLLARIATLNTSFRFPFRCDEPETRRFMELSITYGANDDTYEFSSKLLRFENREYQMLLGAEKTPSDDVVTCCAWCKKFALPDNKWVEVEEAVKTLELFVFDVMPRVSHGICPVCKSDLLSGLDALQDSRSEEKL